MPQKLFFRCALLTAMAVALTCVAQAKPQYQYFRTGSAKDVAVTTRAGFALMGGGKDLDEAFRWMCERAGGGDFLVVRATGDDDYNPYIAGLEDGALCKLNSVATLILPNREAAMDPFAAQTIAHAEAIFIAGGDQANYVRFWMGTPVQAEINKAIQRGVSVGGTSAGLAVLSEWAYSAEGDKPDDPNLDAKTALMDPMGPRVTLVHGFLKIPVLKGIITDSHFAKRDRMGRLLAFLARIQTAAPADTIHGLGIEERAAVLLEADGHGTVVGHGSAYMVETVGPPKTLEQGKPLPGFAFRVQKIEPGKTLDLSRWAGNAPAYVLAVRDGAVSRIPERGPIY
jgi:cyanophycinase